MTTCEDLLLGGLVILVSHFLILLLILSLHNSFFLTFTLGYVSLLLTYAATRLDHTEKLMPQTCIFRVFLN